MSTDHEGWIPDERLHFFQRSWRKTKRYLAERSALARNLEYSHEVRTVNLQELADLPLDSRPSSMNYSQANSDFERMTKVFK
jgi:hypothetical protein